MLRRSSYIQSVRLSSDNISNEKKGFQVFDKVKSLQITWKRFFIWSSIISLLLMAIYTPIPDGIISPLWIR